VNDLSRRLVVSSISILIFVCLIFFAFQPLFKFVVAGAVAALSGIAVWEYGRLVKTKDAQIIMPALITLSVGETLAFFLQAMNPIFNSLPIVLFFVGFLLLFALHFGENKGAIIDLAVSSFGLLYIAVPMGMVLGVLYLPMADGRWWIAYLLVVTKITDVGGYFAGNLLGTRKLAPSISPKKTIEGAIFGLICALIASYLFHLGSDYAGSFHLGTFEWVFLGLLLGIAGQFGDLSESLLKRDANIKDSNTLPGLGGVLDSVDSILFNSIIIYIYLYFIKL